jgi:hypothetical protein
MRTLFCRNAQLLLFVCGTMMLCACSDGYQSVFNGTSLDGWDYDPAYWRVENGCMVGEVTPSTILSRNTFIIKKDLVLKDFELKVDYRISESGNSGISYRNEQVADIPHALKGYQADIDGKNKYTGQNYEERGRQFLALRGQTTVIDANYRSPSHQSVGAIDFQNDPLNQYIHKNDWNEYHIIAKGNRLQHYINGVLMSDVTDNDTENSKLSGLLGVQVHVGPPMTVEYRNFRIKHL